MKLANKVALLTGIESETGKAIALALAREGAKVAGCCAKAASAQESVRGVESAGGSCLIVEGDPGKIAGAKAIVEKTVERYGGLDILVNYGAARRVVGTIMDITEEEFDEEMAADLKSVIFLSRHAIQAMIPRAGGSIINHSSIAGYGCKGRALRSASKAALNSLTVAMALDHGTDHIRVNALLVGPTLTSDLARRPEQIAQLQKEAALRELHTPEDVAAAVVFLASDDSKHITGVQLPLDAGRCLPTF